MLGPLARFNQTIDRCYRLVDHYKEQSRIGRPGQHLADVLRGTIVLTMRASRALVHDLRRPAGPPLGTRARDHLRWMTVQRPEMIEELVVNVLGADLPWRTAAVELTRDSRRAWTDAEVRARLGVLVERRNAIAHRGDLRPSGRSESIRRANVEVDILLADEVGHAIRDVIRQRL